MVQRWFAILFCMSASEISFSGGLLIELPRDQAKSFFGCREVAAVREFLQTHLANDATQRIDLDGGWKILAQCFGDGTLVAGSGEPPLGWCFLAGRQMPAADGAVVNLLRPDMVGHIVTRLSLSLIHI